MAVSTSVSPYYDDFNEDNNFVRVLFKPGVAVQSRELTQSQTILQNQIKKVGDYLFSDGDKVSGPKPSVNLDVRTIRLTAVDNTNVPINVNNFLGKYVRAVNSDVIGYVEFVYEADDPSIGDPPSIIISLKKYSKENNGMFEQDTELLFYSDYTEALNYGTDVYNAITAVDVTRNAVSTLTPYSTSVKLTNPSTIIEVGDLLVHPALTKLVYVAQVKSSLEIILNEAPGVVIGGENVSYVKKATCPTSIVTQDAAVFYKYGFFVKSTIQRIVPDKNTAFPTKLIALLSDQRIVTSDDDSTLLDPALGSSNYFAAGADRLKIDVNIATIDLDSDGKPTITEDIIPLINFNKGKIEYLKELSVDSVLEARLAERTYDQSGSYVVDQFLITPTVGLESDDNMVFKIESGKAYVGGYQVKTVGPTEIIIPKTRTVETKVSYNINTAQGNYLRVSNVAYSLIPTQQFKASTSFLEMHSVRNPSNASTRVGIVGIKAVEYDSSLGQDTQYRMYYNYFATEPEAPATWTAWSTKYKIPAYEGQYIANALYTNNGLLGNYGPASTAYYGTFREPDVNGVAYWWSVWQNNGKDIDKVKQAFVTAVLAAPNSTDYPRILTTSKSYLEVINNSPFIDGLLNVKRVRSLVGVANELTDYSSSATYASPFFYADISDPSGLTSTGEVIIFDSNPAQRLVYDLNKSYVKTLQNIKTEYTKVIKNAIFSGGIYTKTISVPETYTLGDGVIPASTARTNFAVLVKAGATGLTPLGTYNFERGTVTISGDASTVTINTGDASFNGLADISIKIQNDDTQPRTKTLIQNAVKIINIESADVEHSLGVADIFKFGGVYKLEFPAKYKGNWSSSNTYTYNDIVTFNGTAYTAKVPTTNVLISYSNAWTTMSPETLSNYVLDNGQRDELYDHGSIKFIGATSNIPDNILISFDYFRHSGEGPCTVDSYEPALYGSIPTYLSVSDSNKFNLRDCIDFRPRRKDADEYQEYDAAIIPSTTVATEADVTYYLGRRDRIYVTNTLQNYESPYNKFFVEQGTENTAPESTLNNSDISKLCIATLSLPPYVVSSFDVTITYEDTKRYTMKDIGRIDKLTVQLDKSIKLHSIEIANLKSIITNDNGDTLLKSGILVESFADFSRADIESGYFTCLINKQDKSCFPGADAHNLSLNITSQNDATVLDDIITMKYVEEVFVSQLEANSTVNPNPGAINNGRGRAKLSKKNSFSLNLLLTGGLMLVGSYIASTAFIGGAIAAFQGEAILAAAWQAAQFAGYSVLESIGLINYAQSTFGWFGTASSAGEVLVGLGDSAVAPTISNLYTAFTESFTSWLGPEALGDAALSGSNLSFLTTGEGILSTVGQNIATGFSAVSGAVSNFGIQTLGLEAGGVGLLAFEVVAAVAIIYVASEVLSPILEPVGDFLEDTWESITDIFSDEKAKENIKLEGTLPNGLNVYSFEYIKELKAIAGFGRYIGLMAQEVERMFPDAVSIHESGYKTVNYKLVGI